MNPEVVDRLAVAIGAPRSRRRTIQALAAAVAGAAAAALGLSDVPAKGKAHRQGHHQRAAHDLAAAKKHKRKKHKKGKGKHPTCNATPPAAGSVFTVDGRDILDPFGNAVVLRGVNKMSVFDDEDPRGEISFPEIARTRANTVRIVWAIEDDHGKTDPDDLRALIDNAIDAGLLPMIELHDATGDLSRLGELVDYWTRPNIVNIITNRQDALLVNIGNEVGDDQVGNGQFRDAYTKAVQRMRCAGIHTPLVIDAPDFGKNLDVLNATAGDLLEADPDHNLIFSVHMYWGIHDGADNQFIIDALDNAVARNYPLIVGEFSKFGAFNGDDSICAEGGRIDYQTILGKTDELGIGWYVWEWGPGNGFEDPLCDVMDMTPDRLFDHLKPGWATEVALTSPFSIQNTAQPIL